MRIVHVTWPQWKVLSTLKRHEGLNQNALAERLEVEPITLCRMIDRLEAARLVERRRDPADRRAWRIFLNPNSGTVIAQLRSAADDLAELAMAGIPVRDQDRLITVLRTIKANLNSRAFTGRVDLASGADQALRADGDAVGPKSWARGDEIDPA